MYLPIGVEVANKLLETLFIYVFNLFLYLWFNDIACGSDYIVSNDRKKGDRIMPTWHSGGEEA
jgi:hypothetical protein